MIDNREFESLPLFFEGDSRVLKALDDPDYLIGKLKPTIFSIKASGPVPLPGIDGIRTKLNDMFCKALHEHGVKTSTVKTTGDLILMKKEKVPPIEIVVKSAFVGSPKHIYKGLSDHAGRNRERLRVGARHKPYVRFDWRNPLPDEDWCMPPGLADHFIDTRIAEQTALKAYEILRDLLRQHEFDLLDICFFMNEAGDTICAEVSTDNTQIIYTGEDPELTSLFSSREKEKMIQKGQVIYDRLSKGSL